MNPLTILTFIPTILRLVDTVKTAISTGLSFKNIGDAIKDKGVLDIFESLGEQMFPKVAPELRAVAAIVASYDPNYVMWVQNCLNKLVVPSPALAVDGHYGPRTQAATISLQEQLGLKTDGWVGDITTAAIQGLLSKLEAHEMKTVPVVAPTS